MQNLVLNILSVNEVKLVNLATLVEGKTNTIVHLPTIQISFRLNVIRYQTCIKPGWMSINLETPFLYAIKEINITMQIKMFFGQVLRDPLFDY